MYKCSRPWQQECKNSDRSNHTSIYARQAGMHTCMPAILSTMLTKAAYSPVHIPSICESPADNRQNRLSLRQYTRTAEQINDVSCQRCCSHAPKHRSNVHNAYQLGMHCNYACWTTSNDSVTMAKGKQHDTCCIHDSQVCQSRIADWQMPLRRATDSCNKLSVVQNVITDCVTAPSHC